MTVYALIVTYNRRALLYECLEAVLSQTRRPDRVLVLDNASTDGTPALFAPGGPFCQPLIQYERLDRNTGGAGGFCEGIRQTWPHCDWIWLMDDDTIPAPDALAGLCAAAEEAGEKTSFLASTVFGPGGEPMNLPALDLTPTANGYPDWYFGLQQQRVKIQSATFVSLLVRAQAVQAVGLPLDWYFLWGDDTEYTLRLTRYYGPAYLTGQSRVLHKRFETKKLSVLTENNPARIGLYTYFYRNTLLNKSAYEGRPAARRFCADALRECGRVLLRPGVKYRGRKLRAVLGGLWAYGLGRYNRAAFDARRQRL